MHLSVENKSSQKFSYIYIKHIIIIKMMIEALQSAYSSDLEIESDQDMLHVMHY